MLPMGSAVHWHQPAGSGSTAGGLESQVHSLDRSQGAEYPGAYLGMRHFTKSSTLLCRQTPVGLTGILPGRAPMSGSHTRPHPHLALPRVTVPPADAEG